MKNYGKRLILAVMAICACLLPLATVQAVKSSSAVPVTSTLNDTGLGVDGTNYRVQSDNFSTEYFDGVSSVSSILQGGSGDWVLDTRTSTTRAVLIDLGAPVPGSATNPPFAGYNILPTRIIVQCSGALSGKGRNPGILLVALSRRLRNPLRKGATR